MLTLGEIAIYPSSAAAYLALFVVVAVMAWAAEKRESRAFVVMLVCILGIFSGLRAPGVGIDTLNFFEKFYSSVVYGVEPGYVWLMRLIGSFGSWTLFMLVTELATYGFIFARLWELRDRVSFTIAAIVFFATFLFLSFNIIRQFLVVAIVFWATRFVFKRQYEIFAIIVLACALIHKSSVIALALLMMVPFRLKEEQGNRRTFLLCVSLLIPFFTIVAFVYLTSSADYEAYGRYYDGTYGSSGGSGIVTTAKMLLIVVACCLIRSEHSLSSFGTFIVACVAVGLFGNYLNNTFAYTNRILLYFAIFEPVLWGWCAKELRKSSKLFIMLPLFLLQFYSLYSSLAFDGQGVMPYSLTTTPLFH